MPQPAALTCLLIADDLTGACDAAVHFAEHGHRTIVRLPSGACLPACPAGEAGLDTLAISTESRALRGDALRAVYSEGALPLPAAQARILFKKIDSTLRGNSGLEVALAAEAFHCETAVMTPAFPAMGRTVKSGTLRVAACAPIGMEGYWRQQGLCGCVHVTPSRVRAALETGACFISADASTDADLDEIAAAGLASVVPA